MTAAGRLALTDLEASASALRSCPAWQELVDHACALRDSSLRSLLDEPDRYGRYSRSAVGLHIDFSRQRLSDESMPKLLQLAEERRLHDWISHLFEGSPVNSTEGRPALHMALRDREERPLMVNGADIRPGIRQELARVLQLAATVGNGTYRGHNGQTITDVVNIGIGGSDLGLVMAAEALRAFRNKAIRSHFVSNIDGLELAQALESVQAERTLFVICSKSFTTLETQLNAQAARRWFLRQLPEAALAKHFLAVSVNDRAMDQFGIALENRFRIWDWVGGRYSLWSAVGLALAIAIGPGNFRGMLEGAADVDEHFRATPFADNLPVLLGLLGVWNQNFLGATSHAILPYTHGLQRFPAFLQQLEMESNGKSVTRDGHAVAWPTGTVVWGESGSNAQHAFFQALHQGTSNFAADFIAPLRPAGGPGGQHLAGLANMLAQAEALARGRTGAEVLAEDARAGRSGPDVARLAVHKVHPGGHPSTIILLEALDPRHLGALIALYEHKVFVQSVIWGINPFDQWGVELGKAMASRYGEALTGQSYGVSLPGVAAVIRGVLPY